MARLIFMGEKFATRVYEFVVPKTTVGRGDHNTLTIHDPSVSHTHCEIYAYGPEVIVRDLGSSNGTCVNGERLHDQQRPLAIGQTVKFGSVEARLEATPPGSASAETDVTAIHSHAQYVRAQQNKPALPAPASIILAATPESIPADHTLRLSRPPEAATAAAPAALEPPRSPGKSRIKTALLAGLGLAILALAVLVWLSWGSR